MYSKHTNSVQRLVVAPAVRRHPVATGVAVLFPGRLRARWYTGLLAASMAGVAAVVLLLIGADAAALPGQAPGARRLAGPLAWVTVVTAAGRLAGSVLGIQ